MKECDRLSKMPGVARHEGSVILTYLETCLELPVGQGDKGAY